MLKIRQGIVLAVLLLIVPLQSLFAQCAPQIQKIYTAQEHQKLNQNRPNKNLAWQPIQHLPDYWNGRWEGYAGAAWYKIEFNYTCHAQSLEPISLVISNITMAGQVYLNDDLLWQDQSLTEPLSRSWNAPRQWSIPQSSLKQGQNTLWIKVIGVSTQPSGLGEVSIGSPQQENALYQKYKFELNTLHIFSFSFSVILGLIGLVIWLFHRKDHSFLWYAINSFLWAAYLSNVLLREPFLALDTLQYQRLNNIVFGLYVVATLIYGFSFARIRFRKIQCFLWSAVGISTFFTIVLSEEWVITFMQISFVFWVVVFLINHTLYPIVAYQSKRKDTYFLAALGWVFVPVAIHDAIYVLSLEGGVAWSAYVQPVTANNHC